MNAGARRLFVGIALDEPMRSACAQAAQRLRATGFAARYEDPEKLHLTLAFLGNVAAARYDEIVRAMREATARCAAFELTLDKLGAFPHERKPRIVFAGAREQGAAYRALAGTIVGVYRNLGFTFNDDPVAHVTIARVKDPRRPLPLVTMDAVTSTIRCVTLFESIFDPAINTSRYVIAGGAELAR